jgi:uncharacterized membrane protein YgaE (UPF0421/DUF939 family)
VSDTAPLRRLERQVRRRLDTRVALRRVWESMPAILQIVAAVTAAYAIARWGLGHAYPVLAVTVTINSLGFARDARPIRVVESVIGILIGVALSDGLSLFLGKGLWQLVVVLLVVFVVGRAVSANPGFAVAAAVPSALVLILPVPEGGPFGRTLDALIGGVIALLVTALIPRQPGRAAARDRRTLFSTLAESIGSIAESLRDADEGAAEIALARLRRTQPLIDAWTASHESAVAVARISPFLRSRLPELARSTRALTSADLASRHLRTIARRVMFLVRDGQKRPALAELLGQFGVAVRSLNDELDDPQLAGAARSLLANLIGRLDPNGVVPDASVTDASLVLMLRPLAVDLLVGTGLDADAARALLPPV